jgi:hypothetical protein
MIRGAIYALLAAPLAISLISEAQALTLINRDTVSQTVQINEGGDEAVTSEIAIEMNQTVDGICLEGCILALENGVQEGFEGNETVIIENGDFVITE